MSLPLMKFNSFVEVNSRIHLKYQGGCFGAST